MRDYIAAQSEAAGATYFVCDFAFGTISHEEVTKSVELFAREVMPARHASLNEVRDSITYCYRLINLRSFFFHPGQQCGAKIETHVRVIVDKFNDSILVIQNSGKGIGRVAFRADPLIPVVVRISRVLDLDCFKRRVLSRWLVEMTVNAYIPHLRIV